MTKVGAETVTKQSNIMRLTEGAVERLEQLTVTESKLMELNESPA